MLSQALMPNNSFNFCKPSWIHPALFIALARSPF